MYKQQTEIKSRNMKNRQEMQIDKIYEYKNKILSRISNFSKNCLHFLCGGDERQRQTNNDEFGNVAAFTSVLLFIHSCVGGSVRKTQFCSPYIFVFSPASHTPFQFSKQLTMINRATRNVLLHQYNIVQIYHTQISQYIMYNETEKESFMSNFAY